MIKALLVAVPFLFASGCATPPNKLIPQSADHYEYRYVDASCETLHRELGRTNIKIDRQYAMLKSKADNDTAQAVVGAILFWPALLFLEGGDGPDTYQYQELLGKREAIEDALLAGNCGDPKK